MLVANKKRDLVVSVLAKIIIPLSGLILVPVYLKYLTKTEYGYWIVLIGIGNYLQLANMGIAQTVANHVAKNWWNSSKDKSSSRFVSTAWVMYWVVIILLVSLITVVKIAYFSDNGNSNSLLISTLAVCVLLVLPFQLFSVSLQSSEHIFEEQLFQLVGALAKVALFVLILANGFKLFALIFVNAFATVLPRILSLARLKKVYPNLIISRHNYEKRLKNRILSHSTSFLTIQIAALLVFSTDSLVIGYFLGVQKVPEYALPSQIILAVQGLIITICTIYIPTIARLYHQKKYYDLQKIFGILTYVLLQIGIFVSIFLTVFGEASFRLLTDKNIYPGDVVFFSMVALMIIQLSAQPADVVLMSTSNHKTLSYFLLFEGVLNILLSIWWVQAYGILGVVAATIVARITSVMYIQFKLRKVIKLSTRQALKIFYMSTCTLFVLGLYLAINNELEFIVNKYLNAALLVLTYLFSLTLISRRYLVESFKYIREIKI